MKRKTPNFLLLEPYYGGSHRSFLRGLQEHVPYSFTLLSLPARKWKMRMQLSAPFFAEQVVELVRSGCAYDGIICSTFIDVALLRALLCRHNIHVPLLVYFHENQFAYPNRLKDTAIYQFTALNFTTAMAADRIAFNSRYNLETFIDGVSAYLKKAADMKIDCCIDALLAKSDVLYPGIDFTLFDKCFEKVNDGTPVIVWNHRWEHDKGPDRFFRVLFELADSGVDFKLVVLGQSFARRPTVFEKAQKKLHNKIVHFGYAKSRHQYAQLLSQSDLVVSTARHEFFGMAVLEAVRSGCVPVVPDRLSYRELFPGYYRYRQHSLLTFLRKRLADFERLPDREIRRLTERFSWPEIAGKYGTWLESVL